MASRIHISYIYTQSHVTTWHVSIILDHARTILLISYYYNTIHVHDLNNIIIKYYQANSCNKLSTMTSTTLSFVMTLIKS